MAEPSVNLSIIIVTYNSAAVLADCLASIPPAAGVLTYETIVVDNASTDASCDIAEQGNADVLALTHNNGFAYACNRGAERAKGEHLIFLNPDVTPDAGSIERLVQMYRKLPKAGLVSARLRNADGTYQPTCRRFPSVGNLVFSRGSAISRWVSSSDRYTYGDFEETTQVDAVAGTFVCVSRDRFNLVGGFDERFFLYMEDTDLSRRMMSRGFTNYVVPSAGGMHRWGKGSDAPDSARRRFHYRSMKAYADKHYNLIERMIVRFMLMVNSLLKSLVGRNDRSE